LELVGDLRDQRGDGRSLGGEVEVEARTSDTRLARDLRDLNLAERPLGQQLLERAQDRGAPCVALRRRYRRRLAALGLDPPMVLKLTRVKFSL